MPDPRNQFYDAMPGLGGGKAPPVPTAGFRGGLEPGPAPPVYGRGNINLSNRPEVMNPNGDVSTVRSMSANIDGREVLMPTVSEDARIMSDEEAVQQYLRTGRSLGLFNTPEEATAYAQQLHERQATLPVANPVPDRKSPSMPGYADVRSKGHAQPRKRRPVP